MLDKYNREINYLRLSVTGRCNLNCIYCKRDAVGRADITLAEIEKLIKNLAALGVNKVRLTGGEPLMRKDIAGITSIIANTAGIDDLAMTTNAVHLSQYAQELKDAGLHRLNISLNTLSPERFKKMSRFGKLDEVLAGIEAAKKAGFTKIKFNVVLMRGENDVDVPEFIRLAKEGPIEIRFIEYMPMGKNYDESKLMTAAEVLAMHPELQQTTNEDGSSVAKLYSGEGFIGRIGFITPVSNSFCKYCNRLRITHDMKLRMCLGSDEETDLTPIMEMTDAEAQEFIRNAVNQKPQTGFCSDFSTRRGMGNIGG